MRWAISGCRCRRAASRNCAALNADFHRKWMEDEIAGYESLIRRDGSNVVSS